jgi:hypothetical protein
MNERIRTLLIQAQDLARSEVENNPDIKPPYHIPATQVHVGLGLSYEKFAELLVKECAKTAEQHIDERCYRDYGVGVRLKKHFGVEE